MSYHRLTESMEVDGRKRPAGAILAYAGEPLPQFEPLEVAAHTAWLRALADRGAAPSSAWRTLG